jgi:hypothetical protein
MSMRPSVSLSSLCINPARIKLPLVGRDSLGRHPEACTELVERIVSGSHAMEYQGDSGSRSRCSLSGMTDNLLK